MTADAQLTIGADDSALRATLASAATAVKTSVDGMKASLDGLAGAFAPLMGVLGAFSALVAGGAMFKAAIGATAEFTGEVNGLAKKLGVSSEEASRLNVALKMVGATSEDYIGVVTHLDRQLRKNEEGLKAMGLETRQANGEFKNQKEIVGEAAKLLMTYKEGTDRNLAAQALFGKGADEATKILKINSDVMAEAERVTKAYGLEVTAQSAGAIKEYKMNLASIKIAMEAVQDAIGKGLLPISNALGGFFRSDGPSAVGVFIVAMEGVGEILGIISELIGEFFRDVKDVFVAVADLLRDVFVGEAEKDFDLFGNMLKVVQVLAVGFKQTLMMVFEGVRGAILVVVETLKAFANIAKAALNLDPAGAVAAWKTGLAAVEKVIDESQARILKKTEENQARMVKIALGEGEGDGAAAPSAKSGNKGTRSFKEQGQGSSSAGQDKRMQEWKNQLEQMKESEGNFFKSSQQMEEQFWTDKLAEVRGNGEKEKQIRRQIEHELYAIHKAAAEQGRALADEEIARLKKQGVDEVDAKKEALRLKKELGQITDQQELAALAKLADAEYQIELDTLNSKLDLYDQDRLAKQKLLDEKEGLERQHALNVQKINDNMAIAQKKQIDQMFSPITAALDKSITGMIMGTTTLKKALANIGQSILGEFINLGVKLVASWAATEFAKTALSKNGSFIRLALEKMGLIETTAAEKVSSATTVATKKVEAAEVIPAEAAAAAGGAAESVASIPYVGPALAAAAYAETYALVMSGMSVASARGGFDIPAGVNPLTQLHEREMVLPAAQADAVRNMAEGGGPGGSAMNITIQAWDTRSMKQFISDNGHHFAAAMRQQSRNFSPRGA